MEMCYLHLILLLGSGVAAWPDADADTGSSSGGDFMDRYIAESGVGSGARVTHDRAATVKQDDSSAAKTGFNLRDEMEKVEASLHRSKAASSDGVDETQHLASESDKVTAEMRQFESDAPTSTESTAAKDDPPVAAPDSEDPKASQSGALMMSAVPIVSGGKGNVVSVTLSSELQKSAGAKLRATART